MTIEKAIENRKDTVKGGKMASVDVNAKFTELTKAQVAYFDAQETLNKAQEAFNKAQEAFMSEGFMSESFSKAQEAFMSEYKSWLRLGKGME